MQTLIKNMHSKRFLLIYLAVVAFLLMVYQSQQGKPATDENSSVVATGAYQLQAPVSLPNFLLRDASEQLYTNADLQGRWHYLYFFDGSCQPDCDVIWQVLGNLASRYAGQQLAFWVIDASATQQILHSPPPLPNNVRIIYDPQASRPLWQFFSKYQGKETLFSSLFLIDPNGQWQAGFRAPFTSAALQQFYLKLRKQFAKAG